MNPEDIGVTVGGAIKSEVDERDYLHEEIAYGTAPFDWNTGIDSIALTIKNQGQSGSCGGQAESYLGAIYFPDEDKSAKFTYAPVAQPGGGSVGRCLADRSCNTGWGSEALTPSYDNGQPPSEAFMERVQDITPLATSHAVQTKAASYINVNPDIESIAQAIRDHKGVRIGITGSNNGTWLSVLPQPPKDGEVHWYHWLAAVKAKMINGKKCIGVLNSWGTSVGDNGLQWISEDYFNQVLTNDPHGTSPIWEAWSYIVATTPPPTVFKHTFNTDMQYLDTGPEVQLLQTALQIDGEFPTTVHTSMFYGPLTLASVRKFQDKYAIASIGMPGYGRCGPKTRAKLNELYQQ